MYTTICARIFITFCEIPEKVFLVKIIFIYYFPENMSWGFPFSSVRFSDSKQAYVVVHTGSNHFCWVATSTRKNCATDEALNLKCPFYHFPFEFIASDMKWFMGENESNFTKSVIKFFMFILQCWVLLINKYASCVGIGITLAQRISIHRI